MISQASGEEAASQRHYGEGSDDEANGAVRTAQIVPHMRRKARQDSAKTKKAEKCCGDQAPKASAERFGRGQISFLHGLVGRQAEAPNVT